ncbi:MAG: hypothetical protein MZU97_18600 [Bacillus subtilis]|nr:hypothetical protein [Bacillus subtilis]
MNNETVWAGGRKPSAGHGFDGGKEESGRGASAPPGRHSRGKTCLRPVSDRCLLLRSVLDEADGRVRVAWHLRHRVGESAGIAVGRRIVR